MNLSTPILFSFLFLISTSGYCQNSAFYEEHLNSDDYNEGSIIKRNGEQIYGLIQWKKQNENGFTKVVFIAKDGTSKQTYHPADLLSFTLSFYRYVSYDGKFCEWIVEGENVDLYRHVSWSPSHGNTTASPGTTNYTFYLKKKGDATFHKVTDTKKRLAEYFNDCPELATMLRKGDFKKGASIFQSADDYEQTIMDIVDLYNRCN